MRADEGAGVTMALPLNNLNPTGETFTTTETEAPRLSPEECIAAAIERHGRLALAFSGGIESLLLLELSRPYRDRITVFWTNTGAMFPHMVEFVREAVRGFDFVEARSDVRASICANGYPARALPVNNTREGALLKRKLSGPLLRPYSQCCDENRMIPLYSAIQQMRLVGVINGQRAEDFGIPVTRPFGDKEDMRPFSIITPLWAMTRQEIEDRVRALGIQLPEHYSHISDSLECWCCTETYPDRAEWMRRAYPEYDQIVGPIFLDIMERTLGALKPRPPWRPVTQRYGDG